ncbi:MarR family transcriptional regulator [Methanolobus mangrovi]|uniref:MarR family transcriptional regulator n=1 Tax=Methanolobus mangrovi TaxID=3072977 RepID=A0AA51UF37_9EURY|nr:MarR family transcriptional regulator [Methanolobus mangrovi]WMW22011.1 MarR family transcriptional regulator [Methanolobus mangrovi]
MHDNDFSGKFISYLHRYGQIYIDNKMEPYGIGSGQFSFLVQLYHEDGVNQECLSNYLKIDKATTTRAIKKLVHEGYVFKTIDEKDRRSYRIFLTDKGRKLEPDMKKIAAEWENILFSNLDRTQREDIISSLETMFKNVSERMQDK